MRRSGCRPASLMRSRPPPSIVGTADSERLRVRVVRPVEDDLGRPELHQPPEVEDGDPVGDVADDAEVVRDEEVARPASRACSSTSRLRIAACTDTSSAEVGSSQTTSFGSPANARAIASRCFSPPESWPGFGADVALGEAHGLHRARASAGSAAAPVRPASLRSVRFRIRLTACRRLSAESGFWKTICRSRICSFDRASEPRRERAPVELTAPDVGSTMPSSVRASVVLPLPDSPTRPSVSPGQIGRRDACQRVDLLACC